MNHQENISNSKSFKVISLFSGCGGMDLGFRGGFNILNEYYERNPFEIVWANELNSAACRTYRYNFDHHIVEGDIYLNIDKIPLQADVVIGGFPCQDISVNGLGKGLSGNKSSLYKAMIDVIDLVKPKIFVAENVKGLLMKHHKFALEKLMADFKEIGYEVEYKLYNSAEYGVAQTRERVFIIGRRPGVSKFVPPSPTHRQNSYITAREAISDLEHAPACEKSSHIWSLAKSSKDQGSRKLLPDRPGYTIRAECHGNIQWHYNGLRRISMREAARIQSFPDNFIFDAKLRETERQIGNAVPPILAWHIARAVAKALE